jgi:prepilin-type N-terminal cleavage/methylation domain-containing protein
MKRNRAFSLVEALIVVAVIGIVAALGGAVFSNVVTSAQEQKLVSDVDTLNRSVVAYLGAGGDLSKAKSPEEVLNALKHSMSSASRVPTLSGSKIDERLTFTMQSGNEAGTDSWRAYWDGSINRFVLGKSGNTPGIKGFILDDSLTAKTVEDENAKSSMLYAAKDSWIWDYQEVPVTIPAGPSVMPVSVVSDSSATPIPVGPGGGGAGSLTPLAAPSFSVSSGAYPISSFNLPLTIANPNPAGASALFYSIDFGNWKAYTGPLSVPPGSVVAAQAIATNDLYADSSRVDQTYDFIPGSLIPPVISPDRPELGLFTGRTVNVTLVEQNPSSISRMQYKIGGDPWTDYTTPFKLDRNAYPSGALVQARAMPLTPSYTSSTTTLRTLGVEAAAVTGGAVGSFSNPSGEKEMVTNLGSGGSSDYFAWGRDAWTSEELKSFGDPSSAPVLSKSWLNYTTTAFNNVNAGQRFQIGSLDYFNGTIAGGSSAERVSFTADLDFKMNGVSASTSLDFDFELVNVINKLDPNDLWADADFVKLANPIASQILTFQGIDFRFQLEFGETTSDGISLFNEFYVLEGRSAATRLYGTLVEVGSLSFNNTGKP